MSPLNGILINNRDYINVCSIPTALITVLIETGNEQQNLILVLFSSSNNCLLVQKIYIVNFSLSSDNGLLVADDITFTTDDCRMVFSNVSLVIVPLSPDDGQVLLAFSLPPDDGFVVIHGIAFTTDDRGSGFINISLVILPLSPDDGQVVLAFSLSPDDGLVVIVEWVSSWLASPSSLFPLIIDFLFSSSGSSSDISDLLPLMIVSRFRSWMTSRSPLMDEIKLLDKGPVKEKII